MNLLILSLLMAFGGQTNLQISKSDIDWSTLTVNHNFAGAYMFSANCAHVADEIRAGDKLLARCVHGEWKTDYTEEVTWHPYPLWRMEAQFIRADRKSCVFGKVLLSDGAACITEETAGPTAARKPERTFTSGATRDVDPGPMLNQTPTVCLVGKNKPDFCASYGPIDVPAVQEKTFPFHNASFCTQQEMAECGTGICGGACYHWTCTDLSRSLESSVDGLKHWCHRQVE